MIASDVLPFLLARIVEDEVTAQEAGSGAWEWKHGYGELCNDPECSFGSLMQVKDNGNLCCLMDVHGLDVHNPWQGAEHIARYDPARILAECEAKRQIVGSYQVAWETAKQLSRAGREDEANVARNMYAGLELAIGSLILPYADHPDFREEWVK